MWTGDDTLLVIYAVIVGLITSPLELHPLLALGTMLGGLPASA